MVKKLIIVILSLQLFIPVANSKSEFEISMKKIIENETEFFIKYNIFYQEGIIKSANYIMGGCIYINTKVKILRVANNKIRFEVFDSDEKIQPNISITIVNEPAYSGVDIQGVFKRTFSEKPVDIGKYESDILNGYLHNKVIKGMSKDDVIKALGYPPAHKTPYLDLDYWRYWLGKYDTYIIKFENGVVTGFKH